MRNSADYWIGKAADADALLGSDAWIAAFNRRALAHDRHLVNLAEYPAQRGRDAVERLITGVSRVAPVPLFFLDGTPVSSEDYARYEASLALESIPETVAVGFGLVLERTDMRTWPNGEVVYRTPETIDAKRSALLDRGDDQADLVHVCGDALHRTIRILPFEPQEEVARSIDLRFVAKTA